MKAVWTGYLWWVRDRQPSSRHHILLRERCPQHSVGLRAVYLPTRKGTARLTLYRLRGVLTGPEGYCEIPLVLPERCTYRPGRVLRDLPCTRRNADIDNDYPLLIEDYPVSQSCGDITPVTMTSQDGCRCEETLLYIEHTYSSAILSTLFL